MGGRDEIRESTRHRVHEDRVSTLKKSSVDTVEKSANANIEGVEIPTF